MSCHRYEEVLVDLARGASVDAAEAEECRAHVARCRPCAARLRDERGLTAGLQELARSSAGVQATDAVEARLIEAFGARAAERSGAPGGRTRPATIWRQVAAAGVLICSGAVAWQWVMTPPGSPEGLRYGGHRATAPGRPGAEASSGGPERPSTTDPRAGATAAVTPPSRPARQNFVAQPFRAASPAASRAAPRAGSGIVRPAGFVALPGATGLPVFESGMIVRVEIELPSLPSYGVPIVPDAVSNSVEADLLVGQDGQARAIRLVQTAAESRSRQ